MKIIEDNLLAVTNCLFKNREDWKWVTDKQKETYFFIINRNFSKKYPERAQLLNNKFINKVVALDLWYNFMLDKPYPSWFWYKGTKTEKTDLTSSDFKLLMQKLNLDKEEDLVYLIEHHSELIQEELKFYKTKTK